MDTALQTNGISNSFEPLEQRRLLAFSAATYFPLNPDLQSTYTTTVNGASTTSTRTMAASNFQNVATTKVTDTANVSGSASTVDREYYQGKRALNLFVTSLTTDQFFTSLTVKAGVPVLPARFRTGEVSSWKNLAVSGTLSITGVGSGNGTGTETGSTTIEDNGRVTQAGFVFPQTLKQTTTRKDTITTTINGTTITGTITIGETDILAPTVGVLSSSYTFKVDAAGGGQTQTENYTANSTLTGSNQLTTFAAVKTTTLSIVGTTGNDVIGVGFDGDASNILVVRNGVAARFSSAGINSLLIDVGAGNDTVGPLKVGRMRSTILGGKGNDSLVGGAGRDRIDGGIGNDTLVGGTGVDNLTGDAGDDVLNGNSGNDVLDGGDGTDQAKDDPNDTRISIEVLV